MRLNIQYACGTAQMLPYPLGCVRENSFSVSLKAAFGRWEGEGGEPGVPGLQYFAERIIVPDFRRSRSELKMQ